MKDTSAIVSSVINKRSGSLSVLRGTVKESSTPLLELKSLWDKIEGEGGVLKIQIETEEKNYTIEYK